VNREFRDFLDDYGGADPRIVYDTVAIFVPELIAALPGVIAREDQ
jgi:uncharacterized protein with HEPN domain